MSDHSYYVWKKDYSGVGVEQVKRLRELEKEKVRLTDDLVRRSNQETIHNSGRIDHLIFKRRQNSATILGRRCSKLSV